MVGRRKLPRNAKRLPKGTTRHDYDPEVYAEWQRDRWHQRKEAQRKRRAHRGVKDYTIPLTKDAKAALDRLCERTGLLRGDLVSTLLVETDRVQTPVQDKTRAG